MSVFSGCTNNISQYFSIVVHFNSPQEYYIIHLISKQLAIVHHDMRFYSLFRHYSNLIDNYRLLTSYSFFKILIHYNKNHPKLLCQRRFKIVRKRQPNFVVFQRNHVTSSGVSLLKKRIHGLLLLAHKFLAFFQPV